MSGMPLRINSELIKEARASGRLFNRSIPNQLEHWANIGRVVEPVLNVSSVAKIKSLGKTPHIDQILAGVHSPAGKKRVLALLAKNKGARYGADPATPGGVIRYESNGSAQTGRMVNGKFVRKAPIQARTKAGR